MPTKLYVTDLDGTLLGADSQVSAESARIISSLTAAGAMITVATARTPATVQGLLAHTRIALPAIVMTGAAMWSLDGRRYIDPAFIDPDAGERLLAECARHGLNPFVYVLGADGILNVYHRARLSRPEQRFVDERRGLALKRFCLGAPLADRAHRPGTVLMFAMGPCEATRAAAAALEGSGICSVSSYGDIFNRSIGYLELFAPGVSKAAAVRRLADRVCADEIVAFGDNLNDLPMFAVAHRSYAVANAAEPVRQAASAVIGPNTADAVARFIADDF